jgi:hypothetical protein
MPFHRIETTSHLQRYAAGCSNQGRSDMHMKVMAEQFVLDGDKLTHSPTGATFWMGDKDVVCCEPSHLSLKTGDGYQLDELKNEAWRIMTIERKSCT